MVAAKLCIIDKNCQQHHLSIAGNNCRQQHLSAEKRSFALDGVDH